MSRDAITWECIGGCRLAVSRRHHFGEDALCLAQFAAPLPHESVCDLGTGCGILPLWWCSRRPPALVTAVELQQEAAALARLSVDASALSDRVMVIQGDLRHWREWAAPASFDVVTMNPPYFAVGSGKTSNCEAVRIARHEGVGCTLSDVAEAAAALLKGGGRFCLCHRPERQADVLSALAAAGLSPRRLRCVQRDASAAPWLMLWEAVKSPAKMTLCPPLVCRDASGALTAEYAALYHAKPGYN